MPASPYALRSREPAVVGAPAAAGGVTGVDASQQLTGVEPGPVETGESDGPHGRGNDRES